MSAKIMTSYNPTYSQTFYYSSKKNHSTKKKAFRCPTNKKYSEEINSSRCYQETDKENIDSNIIKPLNNYEIEIVYEDDYHGLMYYPNYQDIDNNKVYYSIEKDKKDEFNNFKTKWKTEICRYWEMYGQCKYGNNCAFAHGDSELKKRKLSFNYKTKPCKLFFELGYCSYGIRCQFSHKKEDFIREKNKINGIKCDENKISYWKIIKEFLSDENNNISHELVKRPRLKTFENITSCTLKESENSKLHLYEDIINIKNDINNIKNGKKLGVKYSEDSYYTNFSSDNNENNNDNIDKDYI